MTDEMLLRIPAEEGFSAAALVNTSEIEFNPIFLQFCAENLCGNYGANYTCPPDCGTPYSRRQLPSRRARISLTTAGLALPRISRIT